MLWLIIKKEIVRNVLSFRFIVIHTLLLILVFMALFLMGHDYHRLLQEHSAGVNKERKLLDQIDQIEDPNRQFQEFEQASFSGFRPPIRLSVLVRGLEGHLPLQVSATAWSMFQSRENLLDRNRLKAVFQTPDFAYVVNIIMSLLALLFVFDAISGEKEQGTLQLLLAQSVPRDLVLGGKWIGGWLSVVGPFSVAVFGGFVYIYLTGILEVDRALLLGLTSIYGCSLLYISVCFTLGLFISTLTHRSSTALLIALLVWIVWILVLPNLAPIVARLMAPVPNAQVIESEKQALQREGALSIERIRVRGSRQRAPERIAELQRDIEREQHLLDTFYQDKIRAQVALTQNLARISPSASFLFAVTRLAGTGPQYAQEFHQAWARLQRDHQQYRQDLQDQIVWTHEGRQPKDPDWFSKEEVPRLRLAEESLRDRFSAASFDLLLLVVFNILFFMLCYLFFLRYDAT